MNFVLTTGSVGGGCCRGNSQLVDVVIFDVDAEVVLLEQRGHTQLQLADVLLHLVVIHAWQQAANQNTAVVIHLWQHAANQNGAGATGVSPG